MKPFLNCLLCLVACLPLSLSGCGGTSGPAPTASLKGKITIAGAPAPAGTTIQFINSTSGDVAVGLVGGDGTYTATLNGSDRVFAGDYQVMVSGPQVAVDAEAAMEPGFTMPTDPIPSKYHSAGTSGETVTVADGDNTYDLDMSR